MLRAHLARTAALLIVLAPAISSAQAPKKKPAPEPPLAPAPVRLWLIAPYPGGPWTLRLDNEGTSGVRIAADIRLLRFEIDTGAKKKWKNKPIRCAVPDSLRPKAFPDDRALILAPGQSYIEHFDPHLMCFGDSAKGLAGGSVVRTFFGWAPPPPWRRKKAGGPYVVEGLDMPETFASEREIRAPTLVLSYSVPEAGAVQPSGSGQPPNTLAAPAGTDKAPAANKPPAAAQAKPAGAQAKAADAQAKPVDAMADARAARLELSAKPYSDAGSPRSVSVTVTAKNAGQRPMLVFLRSRMLSFRVQAPGGKQTECGGALPTHAVPRDRFSTLKPGATRTFTVLLSELCERDTFQRPGLYRVTSTLDANESGEGAGVVAYTASVSAPEPTWIRLKSGTVPFYADPPKAVPTPR